ncbi:MAG TPA: ATP-dependent protease ATPase subunit HslU, partial [bacterium]|nr:ATP-dependent protease ATPase subunit HslU [bacterium]
LVAESVRLVRKKKEEEVLQTAEKLAEEKIIFELLKKKKTLIKKFNLNEELEDVKNEFSLNKLLYEKLRKGELDDFYIEIDEPATLDAVSSIGMISATSDLEEINMNIKEMIDNLMTKRNKKRKLTVAKARKLFISQEIDKLLDMEEICEKALALAENGGIIFIDEIDKIISSGGESSGKGGPNVSREGVQRDILPIVEGTIVKTRYGTIKTDHILFIAAGAFSISKPSDLIPELQGRFPIRVELSSLKKDDFMKILNDTKNSLIKQYVALLKVENIKIEFMNSGIEKIAEFCDEVNKRNENIGARRLHTLLEKLLEDISFECDKYTGKTVKIDAKFVQKKLDKLIEDIDLSKYIL